MKLLSPVALPILLVSLPAAGFCDGPFFHANSILDSLNSITATTVPPSGDLNPYGVVFVPAGFPSGATAPGDVLVANFNDQTNTQGTGTTIVSISPTGQQTVFATSALIGLDTALGVLSRGFVVVGNLPVTGGTPGQGSLQIFDRNGKLVTTLNDASLLDSPWDLAINDGGSQAEIFVSNVLSGTVTRVNVSVTSNGVTVTGKTRIGSGFAHQPNSAAVVVGPTGLAFDNQRRVLYVASTDDNEIFGIGDADDRTSDAGKGFLVFSDANHLHGPLGMVLAPNGNLITANGDAIFAGGTPNELIEFTRDGSFVAAYQIDGGAPGAAFGVASTVSQGAVRFAAVDDNLATVTIWTLKRDF